MNRPSLALSIAERERKAIRHERQPDPFVRHLNQRELAGRWHLSVRTLERWRWRRLGPPFIKVGGRVLYRIADVEAFERANEHLMPAQPVER